jgi:phenylacetate-CoA ligase
MSKITGRKDDMLVIRGVNVYPSEIERVLLAEQELGPDYVLVLDQRESQLRLVACCEYFSETKGRSSTLPSAAGIESRLREVLGVSVAVALLPPGSVPRTEVGKAVRVVRWSGGEPPVPGLA